MKGNYKVLKVSIHEKPEKLIEKKGPSSIKNGKFFDCLVENYDLLIKNFESGYSFSSSNAYYKIPSYIYHQNYIFYIIPEYYENQIVIWTTIIDFRLVDNNTAIELIVHNLNKDDFENHGKLMDIKKIIKLSKSDALFQDIDDNCMSKEHCCLGYDEELKMFYIIDGSPHKSMSTTGTFLKMKKIDRQIQEKNMILRIVVEGKKSKKDYLIKCLLE